MSAQVVRAQGGGFFGRVLAVGAAKEGELEEAGDGPGAVLGLVLVVGDGELAVVAGETDHVTVDVGRVEDRPEVLPADALHGDEIDVGPGDGEVHHREEVAAIHDGEVVELERRAEELAHGEARGGGFCARASLSRTHAASEPSSRALELGGP